MKFLKELAKNYFKSKSQGTSPVESNEVVQEDVVSELEPTTFLNVNEAPPKTSSLNLLVNLCNDTIFKDGVRMKIISKKYPITIKIIGESAEVDEFLLRIESVVKDKIFEGSTVTIHLKKHALPKLRLLIKNYHDTSKTISK